MEAFAQMTKGAGFEVGHSSSHSSRSSHSSTVGQFCDTLIGASTDKEW